MPAEDLYRINQQARFNPYQDTVLAQGQAEQASANQRADVIADRSASQFAMDTANSAGRGTENITKGLMGGANFVQNWQKNQQSMDFAKSEEQRAQEAHGQNQSMNAIKLQEAQQQQDLMNQVGEDGRSLREATAHMPLEKFNYEKMHGDRSFALTEEELAQSRESQRQANNLGWAAFNQNQDKFAYLKDRDTKSDESFARQEALASAQAKIADAITSIPVNDPQRGQKLQQLMAGVQQDYGLTPQEVQLATVGAKQDAHTTQTQRMIAEQVTTKGQQALADSRQIAQEQRTLDDLRHVGEVYKRTSGKAIDSKAQVESVAQILDRVDPIAAERFRASHASPFARGWQNRSTIIDNVMNTLEKKIEGDIEQMRMQTSPEFQNYFDPVQNAQQMNPTNTLYTPQPQQQQGVQNANQGMNDRFPNRDPFRGMN